MDSLTGIPQNKVDKEGALQIYHNKKKKWITRWGTLCGNTLYYQKKKGDEKIEGPIGLKDSTISLATNSPNPPNPKKKKFVFQVTTSFTPDEESPGPTPVVPTTYYFTVATEEARKEWMAAFEAAKGKGEVDVILKVKQSTSMRMKKNVSSAVATSSTGKDIIKKFVGKKALNSIDIVKEVVTMYADKKKAVEIENVIIKIAVKVILLWQNKDITEEDIADVVPLAQKLWTDLLNYCQMPFTYDPVSIKKSSSELITAICNVVAPFLSEKNILLLKETTEFLEQKELLDILFDREEQDGLRKELVRILNTDWAKKRFGGSGDTVSN